MDGLSTATKDSERPAVGQTRYGSTDDMYDDGDDGFVARRGVLDRVDIGAWTQSRRALVIVHVGDVTIIILYGAPVLGKTRRLIVGLVCIPHRTESDTIGA